MITILLIIVGGAAILIAGAAQSRWVTVRHISQNALVSYVFLALVFLGGELYFRYGFAQSENVLTKANQNWLDRYWQTNSLGYRDREWTAEDWAGKTTVMLVGDSFAAGWGLENTEDRFGDVLARLLGDEYAVINIAEYGRSTPEELANLQAHPLQEPDVVILQYFLNDISYAQLRLGLQLDPGTTPSWAEASYLLNFLYHRVILPMQPRDDWQGYDFAAYDNPAIWELHREEIHAFIDYTESIDARLIVVIFPNMLQPFRSVPYVDRVAGEFMGRGHTDILKLFDAAESWPLEERIVSMRDTHASIAFNAYVGEELYARFFAEE